MAKVIQMEHQMCIQAAAFCRYPVLEYVYAIAGVGPYWCSTRIARSAMFTEQELNDIRLGENYSPEYSFVSDIVKMYKWTTPLLLGTTESCSTNHRRAQRWWRVDERWQPGVGWQRSEVHPRKEARKQQEDDQYRCQRRSGRHFFLGMSMARLVTLMARTRGGVHGLVRSRPLRLRLRALTMRLDPLALARPVGLETGRRRMGRRTRVRSSHQYHRRTVSIFELIEVV
ncbi:hypothetical protein OBBRIDRAFT_420976 [Obba rivulosa]|uniref:Uncharacterized protein n=1 Tax=Obba rivulosa TaxID=1052685 RepID=A0A8E2ALQ8_9APHY|nr:hypothetical protein OBBRIDRAFT_420976 [Obba rivulosa]